jgi:hypothetical protein
MTITTLDGVDAGLRLPVPFVQALDTDNIGTHKGNWRATGYPGTNGAPSGGVAGTVLTSSTFPFSNPVSGNTHLAYARMTDNANSISVDRFFGMTLCDRLWHNSGLNVSITTTQTVNSVTWPARDINQSINGAGVYVAVEIDTVIAAASAPTFTLNYTNSDGVGGRAGTNIVSITGSSQRGNLFVIGLQAGDLGVRSVQAFTTSVSLVSGAISLVAFRPIAFFGNKRPGREALTAALQSGFPRIFDNSALFLKTVGNAANNRQIVGEIILTQG